MQISIAELILSAYIKGIYDVKGFDEDIPIDDLKKEVSSERLIKAGMLEPIGGRSKISESSGETDFYVFSALGESILKMTSSPDVWICIKNNTTSITRRIYIKNEYYLYIDEKGGMLHTAFLPILTFVFGACADMLTEKEALSEDYFNIYPIVISGYSGEKEIEAHITADGKMVIDGKPLVYDRQLLLDHLIQSIIGGLMDTGKGGEIYG